MSETTQDISTDPKKESFLQMMNLSPNNNNNNLPDRHIRAFDSKKEGKQMDPSKLRIRSGDHLQILIRDNEPESEGVLEINTKNGRKI